MLAPLPVIVAPAHNARKVVHSSQHKTQTVVKWLSQRRRFHNIPPSGKENHDGVVLYRAVGSPKPPASRSVHFTPLSPSSR